MKKLLKNFALVVALGLLLLSTGCGSTGDYYDLSDWSPPSDAAFSSFVNSMNTPEKIKSWIGSNCTHQVSYETVKSPYEFWDTKIGDCSEAAALCSYVGHENGYTTYQTYILYTDDKAHRICIYKSGDSYGYTSFHGTGSEKSTFSGYLFRDFEECVVNWDGISDHTVTSYAVYDWDGNRIETVNGMEIVERGIYDGE